MKTLLSFLLISLLVSMSSAAILKVASDGTQSYTQISDAITVSASGDTILVMGGSYAGFTVSHRLVVIGAGTGQGIGEGVLVTGVVAVTEAADSSELRSLWIQGSYSHSAYDSLSAVLRIHSGATRIFVWRCFVQNNYSGYYTSMVWVGDNASTEIVQSTLWYAGNTMSHQNRAVMLRAGSNVILTSSVISNAHVACGRYGNNSGAALTISHCIFTCFYTGQQFVVEGEASGVAENCAFLTDMSPQIYQGSMSYSYCAYTHTSPPGATHILTTPEAFQNLSLINARASNYHLAVGSNLIDAGNPGSLGDLDMTPADIGIYGGQHPYVDGGVPDYPFAVQLAVPYSAPLNGTMRVAGRGRVGPGN